jgi:hypothetical protein
MHGNAAAAGLNAGLRRLADVRFIAAARITQNCDFIEIDAEQSHGGETIPSVEDDARDSDA